MKANVDEAQVLESRARELAQLACEQLLSSDASIEERFGSEAGALWADLLRQRLLELAAAMTAGDNRIFVSGLAWSRSLMQARNLTSKDLDNSLVALRSAIASQLSAGQGAAAIEYIDAAGITLSGNIPLRLESTLDVGVPLDRLALQYVQTVVAGNVLPGMQLVLDAVAQGTSVREAYLGVLLPAQREVGRLWHLNQLSVSEEHLVSYTTQRLMAMLFDKAARKADNGYTAVAGAVAGNVHDIGIRAISYLLEIEGWRTIYLGSDIPQVELPRTLESFEADVLLLSVALTSQIAATTRTIGAIREQCEQPVKVLVGGNGLAENSDLWREMGADGYANDADTAIGLAVEFASS